jgi:hypothetical protein
MIYYSYQMTNGYTPEISSDHSIGILLNIKEEKIYEAL